MMLLVKTGAWQVASRRELENQGAFYIVTGAGFLYENQFYVRRHCCIELNIKTNNFKDTTTKPKFLILIN
jgi:hypothetical protein